MFVGGCGTGWLLVEWVEQLDSDEDCLLNSCGACWGTGGWRVGGELDGTYSEEDDCFERCEEVSSSAMCWEFSVLGNDAETAS